MQSVNPQSGVSRQKCECLASVTLLLSLSRSNLSISDILLFSHIRIYFNIITITKAHQTLCLACNHH